MFRTTFISAIICAAVSGNAMAAKKIEVSHEEELKTQNSLKVDGIKTVATPEMIREADNIGEIRDELRTSAQIDNMRIEDLVVKGEIQEGLRDLAVKTFINDNVPPHVIAMGDKAVQAYILENFNQDKSTPEGVVKNTVWESSRNVLSIPQPAPSTWTPTVQSTGAVSSIVTDSAEEPKEKNGLIVTDNDQKKALEILNMDQEDLDKLFEGSVEKPKLEIETEVKEPAAPEVANVVISNININQLVMIGNDSFIDATVKFEVLKAGKSRSVERQFTNLKPGSMFKVENDRFELSSITTDQVVFENLDKRKTFTASVE